MNGYIADAEHIDRFAFTFFNTELLDGERDDVINMKEVESFLLSFYSEACDLTASNLHQFENIFGPSVASVAVRGLPNRVPWAESDEKASMDEASLQGAHENAQLFATRLVEWAGKQRAEGGVSDEPPPEGLTRDDFKRWAGRENTEANRLAIYDWLEQLAATWRPGLLTQGDQGGRPAPFASRLHRIPTQFLFNLHRI